MDNPDTLLGSTLRDFPAKFLVAFSFAGEQRGLVGALAEALENRLGRGTVFYDTWFPHRLAGIGSGDTKLQNIYGERSELVVIGVSEAYGSKSWPLTEGDAIRALHMRLRTSGKKEDSDRILPLRVGDGEVEGITTLFNSIIPDIRGWAIENTVDLILKRLQYVFPGAKIATSSCAATPHWPDCPNPVLWSMANHSGVRDAFVIMLQRDAPKRFLSICGSSETGKSHITRQMFDNCLKIPGLACGRFDFKGTTGMDAELRAFVQNLGVNAQLPNAKMNEQLGWLLYELKRRASPTILIFDTYEAAGEARGWVEEHLLKSLIHAAWLRVIIAGQKVPKTAGAVWESLAHETLHLSPPPPRDWFEYGKQYRPDLTLPDVETACRLTRDRASLLAQIVCPIE